MHSLAAVSGQSRFEVTPVTAVSAAGNEHGLNPRAPAIWPVLFLEAGAIGALAMQTSLDIIEHFLAHKRIAMVGISHDPANFSVGLFKELCRRGYEMIPVNPSVQEVEGRRCFARVQEIQPPVDAALLMTSPETTDTVVRDCAEAGVRSIWMYRAAGKGAVSNEALQFCQERGIQVVPGQCPFMFLPNADGIHRFHGWVRKITGRYPRQATA